MSKTVLITGASTGIGLELAKCFAEKNHHLTLVSRNQDRLTAVGEALKKLGASDVNLIPIDLTDPDAPDAIYNQVRSQGILHLVNNAGFSTFGPITHHSAQSQADIVQVNVTALVALTRLCLPDLIQSGGGGILNVASVAAFQPGPFMATYYASKAFVLSFSQALETEIKGTGVWITTLCPGPTQTEFQARAKMKKAILANGGPIPIMTARAVAKIGYRGFKNKKSVVIPGDMNQLLARLSWMMPTAITNKLIQWVHQER